MAIKIDTSKVEAALKKRINKALQTECAKVIKDTESKHVNRDVYAAYQPMYYGRRGTNGGLADTKNMTVTNGDMEISVANETIFNNAYDFGRDFIPPPNYGNDLAALVEYGNGGGGHIYNYPYETGEGHFLPPRPFIAETREELKTSNALRDAMISGLRANGIEAE